MYAIITIVPYAADYKVKTNPNYYLYNQILHIHHHRFHSLVPMICMLTLI